MPATGTIAEAARLCVERFTRCLEVPALQHDRWPKRCLRYMQSWISDTGAWDQERASLDFKLTSLPETRDLVVDLLRQISAVTDECLIQVKIYEDSHAELNQEDSVDSYERQELSSFSWSDDSSSDDQSEEAYGTKSPPVKPWVYLADDIYILQFKLERLAINICQSGRRSWWQKADEQFDATEHQELEEQLLEILLPQLTCDHQERDLSKLNEVQLRLIRCNLMRRNRFLYARQNSTDMEASFTEPSINKQKKQPECKPEELTNNKMVTRSISPELANALSAMFDPFRSTTMPSTIIDLGYPRPPRCHDDAHNFQCPCCYEAFPARMADWMEWRLDC
ncbi:hypothetical protein N7528_000061 [Penicillium herquei]|nr:hypothetical protein N7528_000061 [Penicillium herquei]